jgi:hypothetical protein
VSFDPINIYLQEAADHIPGTAIPPWVGSRRRAKHVPEQEHGHSHLPPLASDGGVRPRTHKSAPLAHRPHIFARWTTLPSWR